MLWKFYLAWTLSSWGDRLWYFALSMYFVVMNENSLLITAINGFSINLVSIFFGGIIGKCIDKCQRTTLIRGSLIVQNLTVGFTCFIVVFLLYYREFSLTTWNGCFYYIAQSLIIFFNVLGNLSSMAMKISIERDWVIVIVQNEFNIDNDKEIKNLEDERKNSDTEIKKLQGFNENLAKMNAFLRGINLTTGIIAPLVAGVLMSLFNLSNPLNGTIISAIFFAIWNFISCFIEYFLLHSVYTNTPGLKKEISENVKKMSYTNPLIEIYKSWSIYMNQGILILPGLAFSLLFLTVLGFDSITLGYAKSQNLSEVTIAIFQGIGSVMGILGTFAFPFFNNKLKMFLPFISLFGAVNQLLFLFICFVSIFLPGTPYFSYSGEITSFQLNNNSTLFNKNETSCIQYGVKSELEKFLFEPSCYPYTSILVLLSGMAMSRFGLWLNDLSTNQIMQEKVDSKERGSVGGVQSSLNQLFDLIKFTLVILFSDISYFGTLVIVSCLCSLLSTIMYGVYALHEKMKTRYNQVPLSEVGPFRKSMIQIVNRDINNDADIDSFDSFNEESYNDNDNPFVEEKNENTPNSNSLVT